MSEIAGHEATNGLRGGFVACGLRRRQAEHTAQQHSLEGRSMYTMCYRHAVGMRYVPVHTSSYHQHAKRRYIVDLL